MTDNKKRQLKRAALSVMTLALTFIFTLLPFGITIQIAAFCDTDVCIISYYIILYHTILYYIIIILYYSTLYYIILSYILWGKISKQESVITAELHIIICIICLRVCKVYIHLVKTLFKHTTFKRL